MEGWMIFWSVVLYVALGLFTIMAVYVTIFGFRDIRRMLQELRQDGDHQDGTGG
jgi:hypothetical protein